MEKLTFDEEGLSPTEKGRQRYQEKDFAGAIEAFTEVKFDIQYSTFNLQELIMMDRLSTSAPTIFFSRH